MLVKSREMTGKAQTLPWWLGGEGVKTTENKIRWSLLPWPFPNASVSPYVGQLPVGLSATAVQNPAVSAIMLSTWNDKS